MQGDKKKRETTEKEKICFAIFLNRCIKLLLSFLSKLEKWYSDPIQTNYIICCIVFIKNPCVMHQSKNLSLLKTVYLIVISENTNQPKKKRKAHARTKINSLVKGTALF